MTRNEVSVMPSSTMAETESGRPEVDHQNKPRRKFSIHCKSILPSDWPPIDSNVEKIIYQK